MMTDSFTERGGFLRRIFALLIDIVVVGSILHAIGTVAYSLTGGLVQSAGVVRVSTCETSPSPPSGIVVPPEFGANAFAHCRHSLFGLQSAHTLSVARVTPTGVRSTHSVFYTIMLDHNGRPIRGIWLDVLWLPLLIVYRAIFESSFGATAGKWLLGERVVDQFNTCRDNVWQYCSTKHIFCTADSRGVRGSIVLLGRSAPAADTVSAADAVLDCLGSRERLLVDRFCRSRDSNYSGPRHVL